jgi:hypothetical protein
LVRAAVTAAQADELIGWVTGLRDRITDNHLRRIASTRLLVNGAAAMKAGGNLADVQRRYYLDWSRDELAKIAGV